MTTVSDRTDANRATLCQGLLLRAGSALAALPARMLRRLARWAEHRRQIGQLAELDERLLKDIGLDGTGRWRVPGTRRGPQQDS